jgi:hypothetical protein
MSDVGERLELGRVDEGADVADVDSALMWRPHNTEVMLAEHREEEGG